MSLPTITNPSMMPAIMTTISTDEQCPSPSSHLWPCGLLWPQHNDDDLIMMMSNHVFTCVVSLIVAMNGVAFILSRYIFPNNVVYNNHDDLKKSKLVLHCIRSIVEFSCCMIALKLHVLFRLLFIEGIEYAFNIDFLNIYRLCLFAYSTLYLFELSKVGENTNK